MNEENQTCTEQCAAIASVVDHEITRRKLDAIADRIKKTEDDTPPFGLVFHDIEGLFDKDGFLKYYSTPIWSAKEFAEEFELPEEEVARFIEHSFPMLCWEARVYRRINSLKEAIKSLGDKYFKQKREFAELKDSYGALKANKYDPLNDEDCPKCKKLRSELVAEQIRNAQHMLRASNLERKVNELFEELKEANTELEAHRKVSLWEKLIVVLLGLSVISQVISLIFS